MPGFISEADDLVLNGRAITGANAVNHAAVHGSTVEVLPNDAMGFFVCPGQVAGTPVFQLLICQEGERGYRLITGLNFHFVKVDGTLVDSCRGAGLESTELKAQCLQAFRQILGVLQPLRAAAPAGFADDDASLQVNAGGNYHRLAGDSLTGHGSHGTDPVIFYFNGLDFPLTHQQMRLGHQGTAHAVLICLLVCLRTQGVDSRPFAGVQHTALQESVVNSQCHFAAKRIQLPHQMSLGTAADDRVAGHQRYAVHVKGNEHRINAHASSGQCRLTACVTAADHHQVCHGIRLLIAGLLAHVGCYIQCGSICGNNNVPVTDAVYLCVYAVGLAKLLHLANGCTGDKDNLRINQLQHPWVNAKGTQPVVRKLQHIHIFNVFSVSVTHRMTPYIVAGEEKAAFAVSQHKIQGILVNTALPLYCLRPNTFDGDAAEGQHIAG